MVVFRETLCRSVLSRCQIPGIMYSINPYIGCQHACVYCYARFMLKYRHQDEKWGEFVDIKVNAPQALAKQIYKAEPGLTLMSSVTDPYQPVEERYELSRNVLQRLLRRDFPLTILTKSSLVVRDLDLLKKFSECEVGMTVTTLDEGVKANFEPYSSSVGERLEALKAIGDEGLKTYAFIGPILPFFTEETFGELVHQLKEVGVGRVLVDRLNIKYGNWEAIKAVLEKHHPDLLSRYRGVLFHGNDYFEGLKKEMATVLRREGVEFEFCY
jgi:DNA repair photolyase